MTARRSHLYICYRSDCPLAKIGDLFEDTPDGFLKVKREEFRSPTTGQSSWRLQRSDPPLLIIDNSLRQYLVKVHRPLTDTSASHIQ